MKRCYLYLFILIEMCCLSELSAKSCGKVFKGNDPAVRYVGRTLVSSDGSVSLIGWAPIGRLVLRAEDSL